MSTFVFSPDRIRELRQRPDRVNAILVLPSATVKNLSPGERRIRHFYREYRVLDGDGKDTGTKKREPVQTLSFEGELRRDHLTVFLVETVDVYAERATRPLRVLDEQAAQACGFKTTEEAQTNWRLCHPYSPLAALIWFALGDQRDHDRYLRRYIWRGGDYSGHRGDDVIDNLPALTPEQLQIVAANNHQRHLRRRADIAQDLSQETLAQRAARLENASEAMRQEIRCELRIMVDRTARGMRKLRRLSEGL